MPEVTAQSKPTIARELSKRAKAIRTFLCLVWFLAMRAFGNLSLAWGAKHLPGLSINPEGYLRAMLNPFVAFGILMLIGGVLARLALLSLADLSFVLPMTSIGYIISALTGHFFLHESVSAQRWLGVTLIILAAILVASTSEPTRKTALKSSHTEEIAEVDANVAGEPEFASR